MSTLTTHPTPARAQAAGLDRYHWASVVCGVQGLYYFLTGVWPLVSIDTFQKVTGPKTDLWLVQTVGALIAVIAVVLLVAAWRRHVTAEVAVLAVGSAVALSAVDVIFVATEVIDPIYLLDTAVEAVLLGCWAVAALLPRQRTA